VAERTYLEAIRQALFEEMERDERVFVLGEDIATYGGAFKVTAGLLDRFGPARVVDTPLSEAAIVGASIGAAIAGLRPVAEMQFMDFVSCAFDMITNFAAKARYRWGAAVPLVVRGPCGGYVHGGPFHSQNVEACFFHTPGLKIVAPSTPRDARGLLKAAVRDDNPVLYLEHKFLYRRLREEVPDGDPVVPIGRAAVRREGRDLTIVTYGALAPVCLGVAEELAASGADVGVVDLRTLLPLDEETILEEVSRSGRLLVAHEDALTGGIGAEVAARVAEKAFEYLDAPVRRVAAADTPIPFSPPLEERVLPGRDDVLRAARETLDY
jgi:2-oxoisovalerate dehydrogenase E1 component beta subunit